MHAEPTASNVVVAWLCSSDPVVSYMYGALWWSRACWLGGGTVTVQLGARLLHVGWHGASCFSRDLRLRRMDASAGGGSWGSLPESEDLCFLVVVVAVSQPELISSNNSGFKQSEAKWSARTHVPALRVLVSCDLSLLSLTLVASGHRSECRSRSHCRMLPHISVDSLSWQGSGGAAHHRQRPPCASGSEGAGQGAPHGDKQGGTAFGGWVSSPPRKQLQHPAAAPAGATPATALFVLLVRVDGAPLDARFGALAPVAVVTVGRRLAPFSPPKTECSCPLQSAL